MCSSDLGSSAFSLGVGQARVSRSLSPIIPFVIGLDLHPDVMKLALLRDDVLEPTWDIGAKDGTTPRHSLLGHSAPARLLLQLQLFQHLIVLSFRTESCLERFKRSSDRAISLFCSKSIQDSLQSFKSLAALSLSNPPPNKKWIISNCLCFGDPFRKPLPCTQIPCAAKAGEQPLVLR